MGIGRVDQDASAATKFSPLRSTQQKGHFSEFSLQIRRIARFFG
jgi:hypothetical protein